MDIILFAGIIVYLIITAYTGYAAIEKLKGNELSEEKRIQSKDSFCVAGRKTQNEKTLHADLLLAGITQLITIMVADKLHKHQYIRSLKPLIA